MKTVSLIADEIGKLRAETRQDIEAERALNSVQFNWISASLKRLDERVSKLEQSGLGEGFTPVRSA